MSFDIVEADCCRICSGDLDILCDFGKVHPSNFLEEGEEPLGPYPMVLANCLKCDVVQMKHTLNVDISYRQYWYKSDLNASMVEALKEIVTEATALAPLEIGDTTIDIGCNDGTLMSFLPKHAFRTGYDPALNLEKYAKKHCERFVNDYFSADAYEGEPAKLITSIAMFYDIEDPAEFINDIKRVLRKDGIWVIQMMDLKSMMETGGFDNVCFEHIMYYTLNDICRLMSNNGMQVQDVSHNLVNGGSLRIYVGWGNEHTDSSPNVEKFLEAEREFLSNNPIKNFWSNVAETCSDVSKIVRNIANKGTVHVMGASTKGNTLLQMCGLDNTVISKACEVNTDKYGLRTVGTNIPIISEEESLQDPPDAYLLLPWHFSEFIMKKHEAYLKEGGKFILPLPVTKVVTWESYQEGLK